MKLLANEEALVTSDDQSVVLTNYRVYKRESKTGRSSMISIFLEKVSSVETQYTGQTFLLVLAAIAIVAGAILASEMNGSMLPAFIIAALFVLFWWLTKKHTVIISSDGGGSLKFDVRRMKVDAVEGFLSKVQDAKLKRINELFKNRE